MKNSSKEFINFLDKLKDAETNVSNSSILDLDYFWFLISLNEAIEEKSSVEILSDDTGNVKKYNLIDFEVNDTKNYTLTLNLSSDDEKISLSYDIKKVTDARLPSRIRKYYIETLNNKYRFRILNY